MTRPFRLVSSAIAVLFMVVMVTFFTQLTADVTLSQVPLISGLVSSWLRPPYLYLIFNFIIVTIFASSKLHQHHNYSEPIKKFPTENNYDGEEESKLADVMQPQSLTEIEYVKVSDELFGNENHGVPTPNANVSYSDDGTKESANFEPRKLPGSASFVHPKVVEANTQGAYYYHTQILFVKVMKDKRGYGRHRNEEVYPGDNYIKIKFVSFLINVLSKETSLSPELVKRQSSFV